jgi:transcriptional regulator with XRE-family HTH domain
MTGGLPDLGRVVATQRKKLGLSQVEFAARLGRSETWVSQVERGVRHIDRMSVLQRLADALDLPVTALAQSEAVAGPPRPEAAVNAALALSASVTLSAMIDERAEDVPLAELSAAADEAWSLVHASEHARVAALLDHWLPLAVSVSAHGSTKARRQAAAAACRLMLASAAMLSKLDDAAAAWVAVDRATRFAESTGDPLLVAATVFRLGLVFQAARRFDLATRALGTAWEALASDRAPSGQPADSVRGALALQLAVVAARLGDSATAYGWLDAARPLADRVGSGRNDYNTEFGPPNLRMHEVSVAVELGDAGRALTAAASLDASSLSAERRTRLLVDVARANAQVRRIPEAVADLREALTIAPEQVRSHRAVHELVRGLMGGEFARDQDLRSLATDLWEG